MKILVTGALGTIGSLMARKFLERGDAVTIIDSAEEPRNRWILSQLHEKFDHKFSVYLQRLEEMDPGMLSWIVGSQDLIVHAAASTGIPYSGVHPQDDWVRNVEGTRILLESLRLRSLDEKPRMIVLSSVKPYSLSRLKIVEESNRYVLADGVLGVTEDFPLEPDEPYAASKAAQSMLCVSYSRTYDLPVVVLRCSNLYGPAPCHGPRHGWLTWLCISAVLGRPLEVQGTGKQTRDMLFSDDATDAVIAANNPLLDGSVYNLGGGITNAISVLEAVSLIEEIRRELVQVTKGPSRINEDQLFITDFSKFSTATGWSPKVGVREGITRILQWAESHVLDLYGIYSQR